MSSAPKANRERIMQKAYNLRSWSHMPKSPGYQPPPRKRRRTQEPVNSSIKGEHPKPADLAMSQLMSQSAAPTMPHFQTVSQPVPYTASKPLIPILDQPIPQAFSQAVSQAMAQQWTQTMSQPMVQSILEPTKSMSQFKAQPTSLSEPQLLTQPMAQPTHLVTTDMSQPTESCSPKPRKKLVFNKDSTKKKTDVKDNWKQEQALILYEGFLENPNPTGSQLAKLSNATGLSTKHIKAWFTNKRHIYKTNKTSFMLTYKKIKDKVNFKKWLNNKTIPDHLGNQDNNASHLGDTGNLEPNDAPTLNEDSCDTTPLGNIANVSFANRSIHLDSQDTLPVKHDTPVPKHVTAIIRHDTPIPKFDTLQETQCRLQINNKPLYIPAHHNSVEYPDFNIHGKTNQTEDNSREPKRGITSSKNSVKYNHANYLKYVDILDGFSKNIEDDLGFINEDENSFEDRYMIQDVVHPKGIPEENNLTNYQMSQSTDLHEGVDLDKKANIDDLQIHSNYINKNAGQISLDTTQNVSQKLQSASQFYQHSGQPFKNPGQSFQSPGQLYQSPVQSYQSPAQSYQSPAQSYQSPAQSYQSPAQSYQSPAQSYQSPAQSYQSPAQSYQNPVQVYQNPGPSYQNPGQLHQSLHQTYQNLGQVFKSHNQSYQSSSQSIQNMGHLNTSFNQHWRPTSGEYNTWYHPCSYATTSDRRRNVSAPGWVGSTYSNIADHPMYAPQQHNRQIDSLLAFSLMSQYKKNVSTETWQNVTQNHAIAGTIRSTGKAHMQAPYPKYKPTTEQPAENSRSLTSWKPNVIAYDISSAQSNLHAAKVDIDATLSNVGKGSQNEMTTQTGKASISAPKVTNVQPLAVTAPPNVTMAPRVGTEVMTAMLLKRTAVALSSLSSEPDDVINVGDCTPLAQDDPVFVFEGNTPEMHDIEDVSPLEAPVKIHETEDMNPKDDSYEQHITNTTEDKLDGTANIHSIDTNNAELAHLSTKQNDNINNDISVNSELEYDLEGMIEDYTNRNHHGDSIDVEKLDTGTSCDILQPWEADFLLRLTETIK